MALLDEALTALGLVLPAQEEPAEHQQRHDAALGEHDQAADALVVRGVAVVERLG
jgi:hypothetical protein